MFLIGRCCVLLGDFEDPDCKKREVPPGFNVIVPHQGALITQAVLFLSARLLTHADCERIRTHGAGLSLPSSFIR